MDTGDVLRHDIGGVVHVARVLVGRRPVPPRRDDPGPRPAPAGLRRVAPLHPARPDVAGRAADGDAPLIWRLTFATAGIAGMIAVVTGSRGVKEPTGVIAALGRYEWLALPLYLIITLVAIDPDLDQDRDRPRCRSRSRARHDPAGRPRDRLRLGAVHRATVGGREPGGLGPEASWRQAAGRVSCSLSSRVPLARGMCSDAGEARGEGSSSDDVDASPTAHRDRCESLAGAIVGARRPAGRLRRRPGARHRPDRRARLRPGLADGGLDDRIRQPAPVAVAALAARPPRGAPAPRLGRRHRRVRRTRSAPTSRPRTSAARTGWPSCVRAWPRPVSALILDFVPNHTAPEHPWVRRHPDWFVHADAARPIGGPRRMVRGALRGAPLDRPRSRPELRAVDGHGPARLPPSGCPAGDDPDAARGRHALRRGGLLDGDARARRCLPVDLGRPVRGAGRGARRPPRSASSGGTRAAPSATSTRASCSSARRTGASSGGSSSSASTTPTTRRCWTGC